VIRSSAAGLRRPPVHDSRTKDATIDVACLAGLVTLTGDVKKAATKAAVEERARAVSGVHVVDNELRVR